MKRQEQENKVRGVVTEYFSKHGELYLPPYILITESEHVIDIGTSVLCTKWGIGYPGGGFVQALMNNDLRGAFERADTVNAQAIKFYLMLMYNVGMPNDLIGS
jgi:hypothetical protein